MTIESPPSLPANVGSGTPPSSRDKILETAEALFSRCGYAGVGLREVAQRVGLGKSSLFHHFPTKVHLYAAVLERISLDLERRLAPRLTEPGPVLARLDRCVSELIDALAENPTHAPLLLRALFEGDVVGEARRAELDAILGRILGGIQRLVAEGVERGELRPLSPPHLLQSLIGMTIYHFASGEFGDGLLESPIFSASEVRRRKEEVRAFLLHGAAPRG